MDPVGIVEVASSCDEVARRASSCVIELYRDPVEERVCNGIAKLGIGDLALRRTRNVEFLVRVLGKVGSKSVNHGSPACS